MQIAASWDETSDFSSKQTAPGPVNVFRLICLDRLNFRPCYFEKFRNILTSNRAVTMEMHETFVAKGNEVAGVP